jgi:hypothetical protein
MNNMKFRFWDNFNGEYFYSDKHEKLSSFFRLYEMALEGENKPVLEQFTGRVDDNGVNIYKGDTVTHKFRRIWKTELHTSTVMWNEEYMCYYLFDGTSNHRMRDDIIYNVIGNIHENK